MVALENLPPSPYQIENSVIGADPGWIRYPNFASNQLHAPDAELGQVTVAVGAFGAGTVGTDQVEVLLR
jgi:hypothetical protein